jgi:hypothetical protein
VFKAAFYEAASKAFPPEKIELSDGRLYLEIYGTTQENANSKNSTMLGSLFCNNWELDQPFRRSLLQEKCLTRN